MEHATVKSRGRSSRRGSLVSIWREAVGMWQAVSVFMVNLCQAMTQIVVHASITRRGRSSRRRSIVGMWRQALRLWLACPTCMDLLKSLRQAPSQGRHIAVASKRFFTTTSWRLIVRLPAWLAEWFAEPAETDRHTRDWLVFLHCFSSPISVFVIHNIYPTHSQPTCPKASTHTRAPEIKQPNIFATHVNIPTPETMKWI
jgi:hypothetical protein